MDYYYINVNENSERYGWVVTFDEYRHKKDEQGIELYCYRQSTSIKEENLEDYCGIASELAYLEAGTKSYEKILQMAKDMPKNHCSRIEEKLYSNGWITLWHHENYQTRLKTFHSNDKTFTIVWSDLDEKPFSVHQYDSKDLVFTEDNGWGEAYENEVFRTRNVDELRSYISKEEFQTLLVEFQDELED